MNTLNVCVRMYDELEIVGLCDVRKYVIEMLHSLKYLVVPDVQEDEVIFRQILDCMPRVKQKNAIP